MSDARLGHMIRAIQGKHHYKRVSGSWWGRRQKKGRMFRDKDIKEAFGLSDERFEAALAAYPDPAKAWSESKVMAAYTAFVKEQRRWPTRADWGRKGGHGLPAESTMRGYFGSLVGIQGRYARTQALWPDLILSIRNATVRRDALEKYGIERFLRNGKGELRQQDDFGKLWRLPGDGVDEHMQYVEVVNKTPRVNEETGEVVTKDGAPVYDHYFLRVPPEVATARDAVAWGYEVPAEEFAGFSAES